MILELREYPEGIELGDGDRVLYDVDANTAWYGGGTVQGHALVWELGDGGDPLAKLSAPVTLDDPGGYLLRCDRVDFPPGGVAYRHAHSGPGIRCLLQGSLHVDGPDGDAHTYRPLDAWFEGADLPVLATASPTEATAFVRVMVLPREWAGRRTIRYLDPADEDKPKTQRATILLEQPIEPS